MSAGRLGKSDHEVLLIELDMAGEAGKRKERVKNWRKANWTGMREELRDRDWAGEMEGLNCEEAWQLLKGSMEELVDTCPSQRVANS